MSDVSGLSMRYGPVPVLAKAAVDISVLFQLKQVGHPDSVTCVGDLEGKLTTPSSAPPSPVGRPRPTS